eukprot:4105711-Alexandrium_andersonii.AAC.1
MPPLPLADREAPSSDGAAGVGGVLAVGPSRVATASVDVNAVVVQTGDQSELALREAMASGAY